MDSTRAPPKDGGAGITVSPIPRPSQYPKVCRYIGQIPCALTEEHGGRTWHQDGCTRPRDISQAGDDPWLALPQGVSQPIPTRCRVQESPSSLEHTNAALPFQQSKGQLKGNCDSIAYRIVGVKTQQDLYSLDSSQRGNPVLHHGLSDHGRCVHC